ncbi:hypothetical protein ANPL_00870 [Anaplasma platys]|uniref:Uncharacterized protein n=1 Tax=Anaplasma platys TaxID=949 RepID=A0A858PXI0_9RICK|nr:hypothetical protein ANPL_00870 [Anaplasma platys]
MRNLNLRITHPCFKTTQSKMCSPHYCVNLNRRHKRPQRGTNILRGKRTHSIVIITNTVPLSQHQSPFMKNNYASLTAQSWIDAPALQVYSTPSHLNLTRCQLLSNHWQFDGTRNERVQMSVTSSPVFGARSIKLTGYLLFDSLQPAGQGAWLSIA